MRTLIFFLFYASFSHASVTTVSTQVDLQNTQQPLGITGISSSPTTQNLRTSVGLSTEKLGHGLTLNTRMIEDNPDYSTLQLHDGQNKVIAALPNEREFQGELGLQWQKGSHNIALNTFGHLSFSPFQTRGAGLIWSESFFEKTSVVGMEAVYFEQNRPLDYFIDRDYVFKQRPTEVHALELAITYEQVINADWKIRGRLSSAKKYEERPRQYGLEIKNAYAVTSRFFAHLTTAYFQENSTESLKNERGYFTAGISQIELTFEPIYDFWVSASYGLSVEQENDPRAATINQVGTDQYGLGLRYAYRDLTFSVQGAYLQSNALTSNYRVSGGVAWTL